MQAEAKQHLSGPKPCKLGQENTLSLQPGCFCGALLWGGDQCWTSHWAYICFVIAPAWFFLFLERKTPSSTVCCEQVFLWPFGSFVPVFAHGVRSDSLISNSYSPFFFPWLKGILLLNELLGFFSLSFVGIPFLLVERDYWNPEEEMTLIPLSSFKLSLKLRQV